MTAEPANGALIFAATDASFQAEVIDRSHGAPVVVELWAGSCRTLGPMLERAVTDRGGDVLLATVDTGSNPGVVQAFAVRSLPAVFGLRDGQVVAQFVGVRSEAEVARFLDDLAPSAADRATQRARVLEGLPRRAALREALELDPSHREAALALADTLVGDDPDAALALVAPHRPDPVAEAVVARVELARDAGGADDLATLRSAVEGDRADGGAQLALGRALVAHGEHAEAIDRLLAAIELGGDARGPALEQLVALFGMLGDADPRVVAARPRLSRALL